MLKKHQETSEQILQDLATSGHHPVHQPAFLSAQVRFPVTVPPIQRKQVFLDWVQGTAVMCALKYIS